MKQQEVKQEVKQEVNQEVNQESDDGAPELSELGEGEAATPGGRPLKRPEEEVKKGDLL